MSEKKCTIEQTFPDCPHRWGRPDHCERHDCDNYYGKCPEHKGGRG